MHFRFTTDSLYIDTFDTKISETSLTYSDTSGKVLFYSNQCKVFGADHRILENGDTLKIDTSGYCKETRQGALALNFPGYPYRYLLLQITNSTSFVDPSLTYLETSEIVFADSKGIVVNKRSKVVNVSLNSITGIKHGNGRDWWIIGSHSDGRIFSIYLILLESTLFPSFLSLEMASLKPQYFLRMDGGSHIWGRLAQGYNVLIDVPVHFFVA